MLDIEARRTYAVVSSVDARAARRLYAVPWQALKLDDECECLCWTHASAGAGAGFRQAQLAT